MRALGGLLARVPPPLPAALAVVALGAALFNGLAWSDYPVAAAQKAVFGTNLLIAAAIATVVAAGSALARRAGRGWRPMARFTAGWAALLAGILTFVTASNLIGAVTGDFSYSDPSVQPGQIAMWAVGTTVTIVAVLAFVSIRRRLGALPSEDSTSGG